MDLSASNIFFFILSLSMILIAGAVVIGVYFLLGMVKDVQQLIQTLKMEIEDFSETRRDVEGRGKTIFRIAKLLVSWLVFRRKWRK